MYDLLSAIGAHLGAGVSVSRIDYAVDVLAPGFVLVPESFIMHSHCLRADHVDMQIHGKSGRITSVTVGKMPARQVIVYDKRAEAIAHRKTHWWEIWNRALATRGLPLLEPAGDRSACAVWRVEMRAGKDLLKDRWGIRDWAELAGRGKTRRFA
jgi:hypothetical protein